MSMDPTAARDGLRLARRAVNRARAPIAFRTRYVRPLVRDLGDSTHVVASREGLFAVSEQGWRQILHGQFFGTTWRDDSLFVFEALGPYRPPVGGDAGRYRRGRVVQLELGPRRIERARVVLSGLANGVHQIDFIGGRLHLVDTYNSRVLRLERDLSSVEAEFHPFGHLEQENWDAGYPHVNSITARDGRIYLLKHNGRPDKAVRRSELVEVDDEFNVISVEELNGNACHNVVVREDGRLLICGSDAGELIDGHDVLARVDSMFTRGLSVDADTVVVGSSKYTIRGGRHGRRYVPGRVSFLDRDLVVRRALEIPAAPTDIRRLDGLDLGLADFRPEHSATIDLPSRQPPGETTTR